MLKAELCASSHSTDGCTRAAGTAGACGEEERKGASESGVCEQKLNFYQFLCRLCLFICLPSISPCISPFLLQNYFPPLA